MHKLIQSTVGHVCATEEYIKAADRPYVEILYLTGLVIRMTLWNNEMLQNVEPWPTHFYSIHYWCSSLSREEAILDLNYRGRQHSVTVQVSCFNKVEARRDSDQSYISFPTLFLFETRTFGGRRERERADCQTLFGLIYP